MDNVSVGCSQDSNHGTSTRVAAQTLLMGTTRRCALQPNIAGTNGNVQHCSFKPHLCSYDITEEGCLSSSDNEEIEVDDNDKDSVDVGKEDGGSVRDELDELLGLQVQFDQSPVSLFNHSTFPCNHSATSWAGNKPVMSLVSPQEGDQWCYKNGGGCLTKARRKRHMQQVDVSCDTYKVWSCLRLSLGLKSDPDVATFLLQHYESTKNILLRSYRCKICHQSLSLICSQCNQPQITPCSSNHQASALHLPHSPTPHTAIPESFRSQLPNHLLSGSEDSPSPPEPATKRKRKPRPAQIRLKRADKCNSNGLDLSSRTLAKKKAGRLKKEETGGCSADRDFLNDSEGGDGGADDALDAGDDGDEESLVVKEEEDVKCEETGSSGRHTQQPTVTGTGEGEEKLFACKLCPHTYSRACSLKAHMRKHSGEKPFKCSQCHAAFALSGSLIVHHRTHTGDKPFVCEDCGHSFAISSALKQHRRRHTGERPYQCHICLARYSRSDSLKVHMRTHSGDRPFVCEECGANFSRLYCLLAHKKKHSGERPYQCSECDATFTQSGKLTIHARKHTGDRPFQCEQCGASFTQSDRLKSHMRIHSGEKPYQCGECGKGFSHPHSLKVHWRAHTGDRPYKCDICSLTFADPSYFRRHKMKHSTNVASLGVPSEGDEMLGSSATEVLPVSVSADDSTTVSIANDFSMSLVSSNCVTVPVPSPLVSVGFPVADSLPLVVSESQDCYSGPTVGFSVPNSLPVPSLGFSMNGSAGVGFSLPVPMAVGMATNAADAGVSSSDPFTFLPPPLHCPSDIP